MSNILAFPVRRRRRSRKRNVAGVINVRVWPAWRDTRIVNFVAGEMSGVDDDAERQLVEFLEVEALRLEKLGTSEAEIMSHCYAFARRAWSVAAASVDEAAAQ